MLSFYDGQNAVPIGLVSANEVGFPNYLLALVYW